MRQVRFEAIEHVAILAGLAVLAALGIGFRLHGAFAMPLWLDEAYSAFAADRGLGFVWTVTPRYEVHPPLYYTLLSLWDDLFGHGLVARRALGLACGIAALPVVALAADALGRLAGWPGARRRWMTTLSFGLACLHPLSIEMAKQVRPYPAMILAYAMAMLAVLHVGIDAAAGRRLSRRWLAIATLAEIASLWLHALGPLYGFGIALALAMLTVRRGIARADLAALAVTQVVALLVYLPALAITLGQAGTWTRSTWLRFLPQTLPDEFGLIYANWHYGIPTLSLGAAIVGCGLLAWRSGPGARGAAALAALAFVPSLGSIAISLVAAPVFLSRTLAAAAAPGMLLIAAGLAWPGWWRYAAAPIAAWLLATDGGVALALAARPPIQDWYGTLRWLLPRMRPGDVVWAYPNEGALPLGFALADQDAAMTMRPIPAPVPAFGAGGYYPTGSRGVVSLYPREIEALMRTPAAETPPTIWLLRLGAWKYDPGDRMLRALERDHVAVAHYRSNQIDLIGLRKMARARRALAAIGDLEHGRGIAARGGR